MFGFSRITKYDEEYLNSKKSTFEDLLNISKRFEEALIEYDEEYNSLKKMYNASKNTDYIGLFMQRAKNNRSQDLKTLINEAIAFQTSELQVLEEKLKRRYISFINEQIKNSKAPYHTIFNNLYETEKIKYYSADAFYKELDLIRFIKDANDLENYIMSLKLIYSNFMAQEYSKLKQVR